MTAADVIADSVRRYLRAVSDGTATEIADCYTEHATVEDPVGTEPYRGRAAIKRFYERIQGMDRSAELVTLRVSGATAAFHFKMRTETPDGTVLVEPIDVMTFGEDGRITGMQAFWNETDIRIVQ